MPRRKWMNGLLSLMLVIGLAVTAAAITGCQEGGEQDHRGDKIPEDLYPPDDKTP